MRGTPPKPSNKTQIEKLEFQNRWSVLFKKKTVLSQSQRKSWEVLQVKGDQEDMITEDDARPSFLFRYEEYCWNK